MRLRYVRAFLALYEERNVTRASAQLYITQQGLSRQIQTLERELGVALFDRSKRGVEATAIGEALHPIFSRMNEDYGKALSLLEEERNKHGPCVSIAFAQGISNSGSAEFIFDYQRLHPELHIEILESTQAVCVQKLADNEIDMAFLVTPVEASGFYAERLSEGYMYAALHETHPLAQAREPLPFALLDGESIITGSAQNALRGVFDYFCRLANIHPHIVVSSNYSLNYVNAMAENKGIATVTQAMARRITNPDIRILRLLTPEPAYVFCCTPLKPRREKETLSLLSYVKRHFELEPLEKNRI